MKSWYGAVLLLMSLPIGLLHSCETSEKEPTEKEEMVMAEDSELALLMRQLTTETEDIKAALERGEAHPLWSRIEELHTATPTDPGSSGPAFEGFSNAFIRAVKELEAADSLKVKHYNAVIDRCMDCHHTFCPGPMKRIEKFYVEEQD